MILSEHRHNIPPKEWRHDPNITNNIGNTVAIILAKNMIIPPERWEHDPNIKNKNNKTVEDYLLKNKKEVPE